MDFSQTKYDFSNDYSALYSESNYSKYFAESNTSMSEKVFTTRAGIAQCCVMHSACVLLSVIENDELCLTKLGNISSMQYPYFVGSRSVGCGGQYSDRLNCNHLEVYSRPKKNEDTSRSHVYS